jgi:hypothetical protein
MTPREEKWLWMMEFCKKQGIPPAQSWAWNLAKKKYEEKGMINTQKTRKLSDYETPPYPYVFDLYMTGYYGSGTNPSEHILVSCTHTLLNVKHNHIRSSNLYKLNLSSECDDYEVSTLTSMFHANLELVLPQIIDVAVDSEEEALASLIDPMCMERKSFAYLYMMIATLSDPSICFQFIEYPSESLGGSGLFNFD